MLRGGGTNDLPRMEMVVCFASSKVICFGAQPKNAPDMITIRRIICKKLELRIAYQLLTGLNGRGSRFF